LGEKGGCDNRDAAEPLFPQATGPRRPQVGAARSAAQPLREARDTAIGGCARQRVLGSIPLAVHEEAAIGTSAGTSRPRAPDEPDAGRVRISDTFVTVGAIAAELVHDLDELIVRLDHVHFNTPEGVQDDSGNALCLSMCARSILQAIRNAAANPSVRLEDEMLDDAWALSLRLRAVRPDSANPLHI
jgi:hypothetical protein